MECEESLALIDQYFDGELGEPTASLVTDHLAACASCERVYGRLKHEQEFYLRHECEAEVSPAFWANVFAKAAQEQAQTAPSAWSLARLRERLKDTLGEVRALRFSPLLTAALVLLSIGLTAGVMKYLNARERAVEPPALARNDSQPLAPRRSDGNAPSHAKEASNGGTESKNLTATTSGANVRSHDPKPETLRRQPSPDELVRNAEQKYLAAIALLTRDARHRRSRIDPAALAQFDQALASVDRTIVGTRRAVRAHPTDPVAVQYMLTAYAKKVDVLRQMVND